MSAEDFRALDSHHGEIRTRYCVESSGTLPDLQNKVSDLLCGGWVCVGGISVVLVNLKVRHYLYSQALTKTVGYYPPHVHEWANGLENGEPVRACRCGAVEKVEGHVHEWVNLGWECKCGAFHKGEFPLSPSNEGGNGEG
jgi:hypothetical protein